MSLANQFAAYTNWRAGLSSYIGEFQDWLSQNELSDAQTDLRLTQLLERLREDRLNVAFVAEFSRGKSELINAIFFADFGNRMLPSSAGRTTMCPTELLFDGNKLPCIELLPIQTRASNSGVSEYKGFPDEWTSVGLDVESPDAMQDALRHVSETTRVTPEEAARLGFEVGQGEVELYRVGEDGLVEVPRWRHAMINFPHPLLKQGLVILDTPGLNAIGAEPELTLSLLPNAHAVLFILAADTGVTHSDLAIWKEHICGGGMAKRGRMVVLNKIDGQWDELKSEAEIDAEIRRQVETSAEILDLPAAQVFPVSAQKGLVAKINDDAALLERSRLPLLEAALSDELIPAKRDIVCDSTDSEFGDVSRRVRGLLESRLARLARATDRIDRVARQEQGRRRVHDGQGSRREGRVRVRPAALLRGAQCFLDADQQPVRPPRSRRPAPDDAKDPRCDARSQFLEDAVGFHGGVLQQFARGADQVEPRDQRNPVDDGGRVQAFSPSSMASSSVRRLPSHCSATKRSWIASKPGATAISTPWSAC